MELTTLSTTASDPHTRSALFKHGLKCGLALAWGIVVAPPGIVLVASVIGAPLGVPIMLAAAYPLYRVVKKRTDLVSSWQNRDRIMDNEEEVPWLMM